MTPHIPAAQVEVLLEAEQRIATHPSPRLRHLWAEALTILSDEELEVRLVTPPVTHSGRLDRLFFGMILDIEDWQVWDAEGQFQDAFTQRVMFAIARRDGIKLPRRLLNHAKGTTTADPLVQPTGNGLWPGTPMLSLVRWVAMKERMPMPHQTSRTRPRAALALVTAAMLLTGCGVVRAQSARGVPVPARTHASCFQFLARAHHALAAAMQSAPLAHVEHASLMHPYHMCLATGSAH